MSSQSLKFQKQPLLRAAEILRVLSHKQRLAMVHLIRKRGDITVKELYQQLRLHPSLTSQHLRCLRQIGLVAAAKKGKQVVYRINQPLYRQLNEALQVFNTAPAPQLPV